MRVDNRSQALALLLALSLGLAAGLLYDLLRPLRWRVRRVPGALLDTLFCLAVGALLFLYAMSCGEGRLGTGALALAWLGFLLYEGALSRQLLPLFVKVFQKTAAGWAFMKKIRKKALVLAKKTFHISGE